MELKSAWEGMERTPSGSEAGGQERDGAAIAGLVGDGDCARPAVLGAAKLGERVARLPQLEADLQCGTGQEGQGVGLKG